ncbi:Lyzozyme M1 (1,4-beta-N-acetylmuramidase), GH25 family [Amycolatopsis sacchari]|uniref:Lysozyme n=1 Tax=Amycolatopsis sacchari TaxID=115433 RepID=A0A1I3RUC8_9PSEU|nr:lysozyme [Amycolatopsis sacchari]SFJ50163.1 Lyzozyme M1 (1,4-beta-N-acetylmuramidase), GH25 family [Amycolatopsis sacchari]
MRSWKTRLRWGAALCLTGALTTGFAPEAAAADYSKAGTTSAGSQIARVEGVGAAPAYQQLGGTLGHDVSGHQGAVDWGGAWQAGGRFVYVKATEGTGYVNPQFAQQYNGSYAVGMTRGAYHFARPDLSSGAAQADYFLDHGGGWSADGRTLPGALDVEYNPYGDACYGKDAAAMSAWIADFSATYRTRTGRLPTIYTSTRWWNQCTGGNTGFGANPLWVARYNAELGALPSGWPRQAIWQFADRGTLPGDQNLFDGSADRLRDFALGL